MANKTVLQPARVLYRAFARPPVLHLEKILTDTTPCAVHLKIYPDPGEWRCCVVLEQRPMEKLREKI